MTTPNIPDLPHPLGEAFPEATKSGYGRLEVRHVEDTGPERRLQLQITPWNMDGEKERYIGSYPVADLIRELSRFVPIPAEARKVITAWLARPVSTQQTVPERADDLLATLAAAGLLVGPGEPAASEGEPWGWADKDGRGWKRGEGDTLLYRHAESTYAAVERAQGPLTPLYAHPPVTAEPATAPSVEQIAEVGMRHGLHESWFRGLAEEIRALWPPAPGDAAEVDKEAAMRYAKADLENAREAGKVFRSRARDAEARVRELEERASNSHDRVRVLEAEVTDWQQSRDRAEIARSNAAAENERLRAALEAAEVRYQALAAHNKAARDHAAAEDAYTAALADAEVTA